MTTPNDDHNKQSTERGAVEPFANAIGDRLRVEEDALDADVRTRLQDMRRDAVAQIGEESPGLFGLKIFQNAAGHSARWLVTGSAMAAVVALSVLLVREVDQPGLSDFPVETLARADLGVSAVADQELLEDLEFIAWMLEQDQSVENITEGRG